MIDPRKSNTAKKATVHLAPRIGTNMAVLNGIQHLLFKNGWIDEEYCKKHVIGLEELREKVKKYTPELVEKYSNVPAAQLIEAAEIIGKTKSLLSTALQGVYQSNQATASACQINNINLLRGMFGKPGCGVFQMNGQPTAQVSTQVNKFVGKRTHECHRITERLDVMANFLVSETMKMSPTCKRSPMSGTSSSNEYRRGVNQHISRVCSTSSSKVPSKCFGYLVRIHLSAYQIYPE